MAKFQFQEELLEWDVKTVRFGAGTGAGNNWTDAEVGKFVKLVGDSRYDLCAAGDEIQGWVNSVDVATSDGYTTGGKAFEGKKAVVFDGLQATPGTGVLAIGDWVVCGSVTAKGTALPTDAARVCKATDQVTAKASPFAGRVVSLGSVGTGAVGTLGIVEFGC